MIIMTNITLHMCTTPRHLLSAIAIASQYESEDHHVILFDQDTNKHLYLAVVSEYLKQSKLFGFSAIFYKPNKGGIKKWQHRKTIFQQIDSYLIRYKPKKILVGNDRRMEFQYIVRHLNNSVEVTYVDEGTATYVNGLGINKITEYIDRVFDAKLKKLVYGAWYSHTSMLGGSRWIDNSIVCFPDLANRAIKKKAIKLFEPSWFRHKNIKEFLNFYAERLDLDVLKIASIQTVFILPHPMFLGASDFDRAAYKCKMQDEIKKGNIVGVKYHPRQCGDPLSLLGMGLIEIPRELPLELFLPLMTIKEAWGDVSSAVMSVKWLCPDANVYAEMCGDSKELNFFEGLFAEIGVQIIDLENSGGLIDAGK